MNLAGGGAVTLSNTGRYLEITRTGSNLQNFTYEITGDIKADPSPNAQTQTNVTKDFVVIILQKDG